MNIAQRLKNDNPDMFNRVMELKEKYRLEAIRSRSIQKEVHLPELPISEIPEHKHIY